MQFQQLLTLPKTIAVIGLSDKPERPSHSVGVYLKEHGFTIIPVNPNISEFHGIPSYRSLLDIPNTTPIDIIDIFRRSEEVPSIVEHVIASGRKPVIWMQEGVISPEGKTLAESHGMTVIMDRCIMKTHRALQA